MFVTTVTTFHINLSDVHNLKGWKFTTAKKKTRIPSVTISSWGSCSSSCSFGTMRNMIDWLLSKTGHEKFKRLRQLSSVIFPTSHHRRLPPRRSSTFYLFIFSFSPSSAPPLRLRWFRYWREFERTCLGFAQSHHVCASRSSSFVIFLSIPSLISVNSYRNPSVPDFHSFLKTFISFSCRFHLIPLLSGTFNSCNELTGRPEETFISHGTSCDFVVVKKWHRFSAGSFLSQNQRVAPEYVGDNLVWQTKSPGSLVEEAQQRKMLLNNLENCLKSL